MDTVKADTPATPAVIELKHVTKKFGKFKAVDDLNLSINKGEIFGFLGPNGAGKSTTIRMIIDAARPTNGEIALFGVSNRHTASTHRRIGFLSGDMVMDDDLTGRQYLDFVGSLYDGNRKEMQDYRHHLAYELDLEVDTKLSRYSRGNKQKVGLVAALMHNPELLILDEPSSGLDPLMQDVFVRLIQDYCHDGGTVFMSSHSLAEVQKLCDRVAFIREGKLAGVSDIEELNKSAVKNVKAAADPTIITDLADHASKVNGVHDVIQEGNKLQLTFKGQMPDLLKLLAAHKLDDVTIREPELEEVFMTYYQTRERQSEASPESEFRS